MRTTLYRNFDHECSFYSKSKDHIFGNCTHPGVFLSFGIKNHWVVSCEGCQFKLMSRNGFEYKSLILESKLVGINAVSNSNELHG